MSNAVETVSVSLEADAYDRLKRAAAESGVPLGEYIASAAEQVMQEREALRTEPTAEENAAISRAVADIEAGRLSSNDEVFARLDAKHGW